VTKKAMYEMTKEEVFIKIAKIVGKYGCTDELFWDEDLNVSTNMNDVFHWGCSEFQVIDAENVDGLRIAFEDMEKAASSRMVFVCNASYAFILFSARIQQMRPQTALYKNIHPDFFELFNACGPERPAALGNPYTMEQAVKCNAKVGGSIND